MSILHFIENLVHPDKPAPQRPALKPVPDLATHVFGGAVPPQGMKSAGLFDANRGNANFMQKAMPRYPMPFQHMLPQVVQTDQPQDQYLSGGYPVPWSPNSFAPALKLGAARFKQTPISYNRPMEHMLPLVGGQ